MGEKKRRVDHKGRKLPEGYEYIKEKDLYRFRKVVNGKRKCLYAKTLQEIKTKVIEMLDSVNKGTYIENNNMTLNNWFKIWIETYKSNLKAETKQNYYAYWARYIETTIGKMKLKDIRKTSILMVYNELIQENHLATGTVKYINNLVNSCFDKAVEEELIHKNPASRVMKDVIKVKEKEKVVLSSDEKNSFFNYIKINHCYTRYFNMFMVMFGTGMRVGECCALCWSDINFAEETISINKTLKYLRKKTDEGIYYYINSTKTDSSTREIPM